MPAVRREIVLPVPRERAWELLTDAAELSEWLADEVELEAEAAAPLRDEEREGVVEDRRARRVAALPVARARGSTWRLEDAAAARASSSPSGARGRRLRLGPAAGRARRAPSLALPGETRGVRRAGRSHPAEGRALAGRAARS